MINRKILSALAFLCVAHLCGPTGKVVAQTTAVGADQPPNLVGLSYPQGGDTQIIFRGKAGPFRVQTRSSLAATTPWNDVLTAKVTEIQPGVFLALVPRDQQDVGYYRIVSESDVLAELKGWTVRVQVSTPANGVFFVRGERPTISLTILDTMAQGVTRADLSTLALYMHGPEDPMKTVTPVKLLNATADRTKTPHHYIDLKTNPDAKLNGTVLTYTLQPVADEEPGTYTVSIRAQLGSDAIQQIMKFVKVQIGTDKIEAPVIADAKCAACHLGPISKKMYLHHIDPGRSPVGSFSMDMSPQDSCKACHNNEGYAAFSDASAPGGRRPDHIVIRAHGVHMGEGLKSNFNTNHVNGNFSDYTHVLFPADPRNCTSCHVTDSWKTKPSRLTCGSCHDNSWFGPKASTPAGMVAHVGGPATDDLGCATCHVESKVFKTIEQNHMITPPAFEQIVNLSMSAPANGNFYVAGDKPQVIIKVTDAVSKLAINPTNMVDPLISTNVQPTEWRRANLLVAGPRARTLPVLTTAANATNSTSSYANNELRYMRDPARRDSRITRTADSIIYQLDDVAKLQPGTYTVFADFLDAAFPGGWGYMNFQVGTTNKEAFVATNCRDCHADTRIHATSRAVPYEPDICNACHDYKHQLTNRTNWLSGQYGYGVAPLARRVHGIHFGNYVDKPREIQSQDFSHVIMPMDVRNCTKCHSQTSTWTEKPSRLACTACHDDDKTIIHANLMTFDPTPVDPWGGDEVETCTLCHGKGATFTPSKVHAISNPYQPPYPRAPREGDE